LAESGGSEACSFAAEQLGIFLVLALLLATPDLRGRVCIYSDSLSTLLALSLGPLRQRTTAGDNIWVRLQQLLRRGLRISFVFILSHCNIPRSDEVDKLAGHSVSTEPPKLGIWWVDRARMLKKPVLEAARAGLVSKMGFRKKLLQSEDDPFLPPTKSLSREKEVLLGQMRTGCVGAVGGWRHELDEDCTLCGSPEVLARQGRAVEHVFTCPALGPEEDILMLRDNPGAAVARCSRYLAARDAANQ